jgi:hypothetical protein
VVTYSGDTNNNGPITDNGTTDTAEQTQVNKANASTGTVIDNAGTNGAISGNQQLGTSVYDTDTVTGYSPTGTVTYNFYTKLNPIYGMDTPFATKTVMMSGGTVPKSPATGALAAGNYAYIAVYNGDGNNNSVVGAVESLTINPATISGYRWGDVDGSGTWNTSEVGVNGVTIQLYKETNKTAGLQTGTGGDTLVATTTTAANGGNNGYYTFTVSTVGTYYIKQVLPNGWVATTPDPVTVTETGANIAGRYGCTDPTNFGDAQTTTGSGEAEGICYWKSSPGRLTLTGSSTGTTLLAKYYAIFTGALANPNKSGYTVLEDPIGNPIKQNYFSTFANVSRYLCYFDIFADASRLLGSDSASNMAYMLSAQLLTTEFNIVAGFVNPNQYIYIPNVTGMNSSDLNALKNPGTTGLPAIAGNFVQIQTAINDAITALKMYPNTLWTTTPRYYRQALQNVFTSINQNGNIFVS